MAKTTDRKVPADNQADFHEFMSAYMPTDYMPVSDPVDSDEPSLRSSFAKQIGFVLALLAAQIIIFLIFIKYLLGFSL